MRSIATSSLLLATLFSAACVGATDTGTGAETQGKLGAHVSDGTPDLGGYGGSADLADVSGSADLGSFGLADLAYANTDTCNELVACTNPCSTQACETDCEKRGSASAVAAYRALTDCVDAACPQVPASSTGTNAPCAYDTTSGTFVDAAACNQCVSDSQSGSGTCATALATCTSDGA